MRQESSSRPVFTSNATYHSRFVGGSWDILMTIPHSQPGGGDTVESIILIKDNCGCAPTEAEIAERVVQLLNMSRHLSNEDLCTKGASLKLESFVERAESREAVAPAQVLVGDGNISDALENAKAHLKQLLFGVNYKNVAIDLSALLMNAATRIVNQNVEIDSVKAVAANAERRLSSVFPSDAQIDLIDTCEALRRSLRIIGNKFGVKLSADSDLFAGKIVEEFEALQARFSQADFPLTELREIIGKPDATPASLMTYVRNLSENAKLYAERADKATSQLEHIEKLLIEHEHHTEGAAIWASVDKLIDRVQVLGEEEGQHLIATENALADAIKANKETAGQLAKADQELATVRGERDEAHRALKEIQRVLSVTVEHPKELAGIITKLANNLTSSRSTQTTLDPFKREVMALCMIEPSTPDMLPSLTELLIGIRDYVNTITRYRGGAMILHDRICQLTESDLMATDAEPYAHFPWDELADRLEEKFYAPRNAIATLVGNFDLEVADDYRDNVSELYTFMKGLGVAQFQHDKQLQSLLADRNADRSILEAIDDLLGDITRPTPPITAAIRTLVRSHLTAIKRD